MITVGFDPGKTNFAYAIVDGERRTLVQTGMIQNVIKTLNGGGSKKKADNFKHSVNLFKKEIRGILKKYAGLTSRDLVVFERMQVRPGRGHAPVEVTNLMVGLAVSVASEVTGSMLVTASTWKRHVKTNVYHKLVGNCRFCRSRKCVINLRNKRFCKNWKNDRVFRDGLAKYNGIDIKTNHEADAVCLACYGISTAYNKDVFLKLRT